MKSIRIIFLVLLLAGSLAVHSLPVSTESTQEPCTYIYREIDGQKLNAYVFPPTTQNAGKPVSAILLFHGGGWSEGSAEWTFATARRFAALGMIAISIEYRLSQGSVTPIEAISDTCAAFRWTRLHAGELKLDPNRVAGYGVSAGGHLVAAAATLDYPKDGDNNLSSKPNLLLLWSPALDVAKDGWFRKLLQGRSNAYDYSPMEHAGPATPPTCIVQGEKDTLTPLSGAKKFCDRICQAGGTCNLHVYPGLGHLLTRNLENQENEFDPDPKAREDGIAQHMRFLKEKGFIRDK